MADSKPLVVINSLRGLDERWDPPAGAGITASVAEDLWWDARGGWQSAGGYKRIIRGPETIPPTSPPTYINPFASSGAIESIHWFSQHNGARRWLIYISGAGVLYAFNPSTAARSGSPGDVAVDREGNQITRTVINNPWARSQSACWGDYFYMVNGVDRPLVFDGYVWDQAGWASPAGVINAVSMNEPRATDSDPAAATKIPNVGLGPTSDIVNTNYKYARKYRVSFINERGAESPLSAPSETIFHINSGGATPATGAHFAKLLLPIGPAQCVRRRIYATQNLYDSSNTLVQGRDTQFFYHSDVPDNMTKTLEDSLDDGFLGSIVDPADFGTWPANAKFISVFKGRMYAVGAGNSTVSYSRRGSPEVWPTYNELDVGDAHLGPITAMYASRNALVVAKARGLYLIKDDGVNEPVAETLTRQSGWSAQNTVREIPGIGIIGLSDDGITILKGTLQNEGVETQTFNAAVGLPKTFNRLNRSAILNATSAVYHRDKEYWLSIPTNGTTNNNLVLVFHYEIREWSTRANYPISSMLETPDSNGNLLFSSYASSGSVSPDGLPHLGIFVYTRSASDKDGTAITPIYQTNPVTIASAYRTFRPLHVLVDGILHGNNPLTMQGYSNYQTTGWFPTPTAQPQQYNPELLPVFGPNASANPATFDSKKVWVNWHPGTMRFDVSDAMKQPLFAFSVRFAPKDGTRYMTICGFSVEIQPGDPVQTKPIRADGT